MSSYNSSPAWAKNAASAAQKRAMNRTKSRGPMSGLYSVGNNGRLTTYTERNKEGREYKIAQGRNWFNPPTQISGPGMPNTWLPNTGYGKSEPTSTVAKMMGGGNAKNSNNERQLMMPRSPEFLANPPAWFRNLTLKATGKPYVAPNKTKKNRRANRKTRRNRRS